MQRISHFDIRVTVGRFAIQMPDNVDPFAGLEERSNRVLRSTADPDRLPAALPAGGLEFEPETVDQ